MYEAWEDMRYTDTWGNLYTWRYEILDQAIVKSEQARANITA